MSRAPSPHGIRPFGAPASSSASQRPDGVGRIHVELESVLARVARFCETPPCTPAMSVSLKWNGRTSLTSSAVMPAHQRDRFRALHRQQRQVVAEVHELRVAVVRAPIQATSLARQAALITTM